MTMDPVNTKQPVTETDKFHDLNNARCCLMVKWLLRPVSIFQQAFSKAL